MVGKAVAEAVVTEQMRVLPHQVWPPRRFGAPLCSNYVNAD